MMRKVDVALGARSYPIVIGCGIMDELTAFVRQAGYSPRGMIVTDEHVAPHCAARIAACIARAGVQAEVAVIPAGEQ